MSQLKRLAVTTGLAAVVVSLALAVPANASKTSVACLVTAELKLTDKEDPTLGMRLVGGKGDFEARGGVMICVGIKKSTPETVMTQPLVEGVFWSPVCGVGKAVGTVTDVTGPDWFVNQLEGHKFAIHYAGAHGIFFWHEGKQKSDLPDLKDPLEPVTKFGVESDPKPKDPKDWQAAGVFQFEFPQQKTELPDPVGEECTKAITATGVLLVFED